VDVSLLGRRTAAVAAVLTLTVASLGAFAVAGLSSPAAAHAAPLAETDAALGIGSRIAADDFDSARGKAEELLASGTPLAGEVADVALKEATPAWKTARVSWYGPGFYGNTMAGGGTLTLTSMVVAHRSLPFGTRIEFEYGGRACVAVVQDRGPFIAGRTFDLGPGTAQALGFGGVGTVRYRILED
jgi:rare lipoprotein A (peptidoglycan hydrolase)